MTSPDFLPNSEGIGGDVADADVLHDPDTAPIDDYSTWRQYACVEPDELLRLQAVQSAAADLMQATEGDYLGDYTGAKEQALRDALTSARSPRPGTAQDDEPAPLTPTTAALIQDGERLRQERADLLAEVERLRARTHEIQAQEMAKRAALDSELARWRARYEEAKQWTERAGLTAEWASGSGYHPFWSMTSHNMRSTLLRLVTERDEARAELASSRSPREESAEPEPAIDDAFFLASVAEHDRCTCTYRGMCDHTDGCALCDVLPGPWPCPTPRHEGYPTPTTSEETR